MEPNPYGSGTSDDEPSAEDQVQYFKLRLLECIAGLDRGFSASPNAAAQVESAVLSLTGQSEPVSLSWTPGTHYTLTTLIMMGCYRPQVGIMLCKWCCVKTYAS